MAASVNLVLTNADKSMWLEPDILDRKDRRVRDPDDWFLEDIAVHAVVAAGCDHCLVVSTDRQTREDFNHRDHQERGIAGHTVEEALVFASEECVGA